MGLMIQTLQKVLNEFVKEYQDNPIKYFYEEDIRAELLTKLSGEDIFRVKLPITQNNEWLRDYIGIFGNDVDISGIKAEYPSITRFDIAYINADLVSLDNSFNHYNYDCSFAIELKLSQKDNKNSDFKSDIGKLREYKRNHLEFTGIAIDFEQNPHYEKEAVFRDYNNYDNLKLALIPDEVVIANGSINYYFIHRKYILRGQV